MFLLIIIRNYNKKERQIKQKYEIEIELENKFVK
jgi:hypothetical protein